ncbi:hypothetical protein ACJX0J_015218, partial [Zea mays]
KVPYLFNTAQGFYQIFIEVYITLQIVFIAIIKTISNNTVRMCIGWELGHYIIIHLIHVWKKNILRTKRTTSTIYVGMHNGNWIILFHVASSVLTSLIGHMENSCFLGYMENMQIQENVFYIDFMHMFMFLLLSRDMKLEEHFLLGLVNLGDVNLDFDHGSTITRITIIWLWKDRQKAIKNIEGQGVGVTFGDALLARVEIGEVLEGIDDTHQLTIHLMNTTHKEVTNIPHTTRKALSNKKVLIKLLNKKHRLLSKQWSINLLPLEKYSLFIDFIVYIDVMTNKKEWMENKFSN